MIFTRGHENTDGQLRLFEQLVDGDADLLRTQRRRQAESVTEEEWASAGQPRFTAMQGVATFGVSPRRRVPGWVTRVYQRLVQWVKRRPVSKRHQRRMTNFFEQVLAKGQQLEVFHEREAAVEQAILDARATGQRTFVEQLEEQREVLRSENALFAFGVREFLTEKQLFQFSRAINRGLSIDWLRHFTRPIPPEVRATKAACDAACLFDDYVVLYIDLHGDMQRTIQDKAEMPKDPILFGVILNSRKLYFVADWIDEYCDLTLDKIVQQLGEESRLK